MRLESSGDTTASGALRLRFRLGDFFSSMWFRNARRRRIFPVDVTLNLFAAPLCVFIFGIAQPPSALVTFRGGTLEGGGGAGASSAAGASSRGGLGLVVATGALAITASFNGFRTIVMLRPSTRGGVSTFAISATSA